MLRHLIAVVAGAIIYRIMLAVAFGLGLPAIYLKLFSAVIVVLAISIPLIKPALVRWRKVNAGN